MAKPVLLVTRKLPEAIEARAAQDYDARLNPQDAPWATDGAEIARRATEASAAGILYRVPEIVTRGRFQDGGESDSTWRTQEARHVGSDTIAPGF